MKRIVTNLSLQILVAFLGILMVSACTREEIHFPGKYTNSDGSDPYMDANGFPWALLIPGDWSWPLERNNIHQAYPLFQSWYETAGQQAADWYKTADFNLVFNK